jgi:hypothetical protein
MNQANPQKTHTETDETPSNNENNKEHTTVIKQEESKKLLRRKTGMTTGSRKQAQRVCGPRSERDDEVLERLEKPVGTAKRCFRVKVVGSNPAGPTKNCV